MRPITAASAVDRIADVLARHYDGQALAELRDEHAAHHREAAAALLPLLDLAPATPATEEPADPCMPFQRYGCGHCPHQDCQNPDCGHCPCKCECR